MKYIPLDTAQLVADYKSGVAPATLAEQRGVSLAKVYKCLKEAGVSRARGPASQPIVGDKITCAHCKTLKTADCFYASKQNKSGLESLCKECSKVARLAHYHKAKLAISLPESPESVS